MNKFIIFAAIGYVAWLWFDEKTTIYTPAKVYNAQAPEQSSSSFSSSRYKCDGREYCSQMNSRQEAIFFINNCPNTKMDGDNDGRPCENDSRW